MIGIPVEQACGLLDTFDGAAINRLMKSSRSISHLLHTNVPACLLIILCAVAWVSELQVGAAEEQGPDLSGAWILKFNSPNGDKIRLPMTLKQEGEKITGKMKRPDATESELEEGTFKDGQIAFSVQQKRNQRTITAKYAGKLEGEQLKGTFESNFGGNTRTIQWSADRKRNDATGVWKWTFMREDGQPMEFTLKLKQDKTALSGVSISPNGNETPLTNTTANGNELAFNVVRERDDRKFITSFHGKRTEDTISGKIEADWTGEPRSYEWTAKRISEDW
jgi:hypothetical protein